VGERVVTEPAPAKLNPFLRVLGRRSDGYHDIETLILPLSLEDRVTVSPRDYGFALRVVGPRAAEVPSGDENLVVRAAGALAEATDEQRGANLLLEKRIPVAAGLGGGSSDAAAALRALNQLWGLGLGVDRLAEVSLLVGSDVPALVHNRPVLARGRGEVVEPADVPETWWVVMPLGFPVTAEDAYRWWDRDRRWFRGRGGQEAGPVLEAFSRGDLRTVGGLLFNDLEGPVAKKHPEVRAAKERALEGTIGWRGPVRVEGDATLGAVMAGSGPTVAALCTGADQARAVSQALQQEWPDTLVCRA
jgi:4-diphosphocytidyl-2-C-methyl-D-erythritol kinase